MSALVKYRQVPFDPSWIDETGFMLGALELLPASQDNEILIGFQIVEDPALEDETSSRRRHTLRNARVTSQSTPWGARPMVFQIGHRKVVQEMRCLMDQPGSSRRTPFNARAVITPHQIVVRAVGTEWEYLDTVVAIRECWLPYQHVRSPNRRRWLPLGQVVDDGEQWLPLYEDGFHRACLHLLTLLFRNVGVALHQSLTLTGDVESTRSLYLAIEKNHELCRRDIEVQAKRTKSVCVTDNSHAMHRHLCRAVRESRHATHAEDLMEVLTSSLRLYYMYCLETDIRLPLDIESPISIAE